ncbi:pseudaminic acid cytidylyltransferase [Cyanobium sp. Cruz-8D1]|uniref:pseudaminic acid cytidylyltransferase n=1 Tax=Cyanobium sp. Cruz-8D1 TaxID=2823711 RepID=UPI0020CF6F80|nr:pseudaminic acid cytidylyltransferase [Cyanobium sp. Cruz-8D1]
MIPARGGSKRIPRKNIRFFCGKPMIAWAIGYALQSRLFEKIIVSTDDESIADVARAAGAETPFLRPAFFSDDLTPTVPVIAHAVEACQKIGWSIEYACCIYPCVPFLEISDLVHAFELMQRNDASFCYPVTDYAHPIQRAMRRLPSGQMQLLHPEHEIARTQDLEAAYHDTGQFYWGKASAWKAHMKMHTAGIGLVIPSWRVVDIDNEDDWKRAELLHEVLNR